MQFLPNESALHTFKTNRDIKIFTEKRLLVSDAQAKQVRKKRDVTEKASANRVEANRFKD